MPETADPTDDDLLALARAIALEAGGLLLDRPDQLAVDTKSTATDVVTEMDKASEQLIAGRLQAERPDDGLLGEEGADVAGATGIRWIVDPLDGTVNYLYDLPFWAVSIGVERDGDVVAGVVHAPVLGWTFTATSAGPSRLSRRLGDQIVERVLAGSPVAELAQTLLGTGFGYASELRARQGAYIGELLPRVRDIRRQGSGALDLCMAAAGLLDAYVEQGLHPWDLAAGGLIAARAGLTVTGLYGRPPGHHLVVAVPAGIEGALTAELERLGA